jgi:hypothetical protein
MPSPFPGMDPYLEQHWRDVHHALTTYARNQIQAQLPGDLRARLEERVFVESAEVIVRNLYPDIRVVERGRGKAPAAPSDVGIAVAEPLILQLPDDPVTEGHVEIIDFSSGKRVVTVIEVLSLSNKLPGPGRDLYLQKREELRDGRVSLVEIDLLRTGGRSLTVAPELLPPAFRTPYQVCVRYGWRPLEMRVYRVPLQERLPTFRIPLRESDAEVLLDLQTLIEACYRDGGYDDDIDYRAEPTPPLDPAEAAWADELLRSRGRR